MQMWLVVGSLCALTLLPVLSFAQSGEFGSKCTHGCRMSYHLKCRSVNAADPDGDMCLCMDGYKQYTPKMPGACVLPGQLTGDVAHGGGCSAKGCAGHDLVCTFDAPNPICVCPEKKPLKKSETTCAATHGGACAATSDCGNTLQCDGGFCKCQQANFEWDGNSKCGMRMGGGCTDKGDCMSGKGMECVNDKCSCIAGFEDIDGACVATVDKVACDPDAEEDTCGHVGVKDLVCDKTHKICFCPGNKPFKKSEMACGATHGGACTANSDCGNTLVCGVDGLCKCQTNFEWDGGRRKCGMKMGGGCAAKGDCMSQKDIDCVNGKCACAADFEAIDGTCMAKVDIIACDPDEDKCDEDGSKNLECDKVKRVCACPEKTEYSESAMACKLKPGEKCSMEDDQGKQTFEHGLCLTEHCADGGTGTVTKVGTCDCAEVTPGHRRIWSSDPPGCVDDNFGSSCTSDQDCSFSPFKAGRDGLVCDEKKKRCLCGDGSSYQQAYCIKDKDIKGYNITCDPKGIPACNVTGTGLTCKLELDGTHKCLCLPKDVTHRSNSAFQRFVNLEWDRVKGVCGLKADGSRCGNGAECRGGRCPKGRCESRAKGGAAVLRGAYAGVMLLVTFDLVLPRI